MKNKFYQWNWNVEIDRQPTLDFNLCNNQNSNNLIEEWNSAWFGSG